MTLEEQYREQTTRLEAAILSTVDKAVRNCPAGRPLKHAVFGAIRYALVENHRDITLAAMANPELTDKAKNELNDFGAAVYIFMYALCELAMDGNSLWSDSELILEQYKHLLRRAVRESCAFVAETGERVHRPEQG